ncbi:MAG: hypothetical protein E7660_06815 [Ruminococcaceae bacterium]|nr:hypothetical protein [Oscillospiraceae bacterium]
MPVNEKALGYTIIFSVFALMSKMTCRWLLDIAYSVSGIPFEKIVERKQLKMLRREEMPFNTWLLENSVDPDRVKKYLDAYKYAVIPGFLCVLVSVIGLFTHAFDNFMDLASLGFIAINMIVFVFGNIYSAKFK